MIKLNTELVPVGKNISKNKGMDAVKNFKGIVKYGIPRGSERNNVESEGSNKLTNAEILYIMEHGSKLQNIPKRVLLAAVHKKYRQKISETYAEVFKALFDGKDELAKSIMEKLAFRMETWCKKFFTDADNNWEPNAPITIYGGWMRSKSGKAFYVKGKGSDRPLIDTGEMRKAIRGIYIEEP